MKASLSIRNPWPSPTYGEAHPLGKLVLRALIVSAVLLLSWVGVLNAAQPVDEPPSRLPFSAGEELTYRVSAGRFGGIGQAVMRVEGSHSIRGREAYLLRFDLKGRVAAFSIEDRTRSWIDPRRMATLRYEKYERHPLATNREEVDVFPGERRWVGTNGESGQSATDAPLDELSFLYHIRMLPLRDGDTYSCNMHFDQNRNPVRIRVLERKRLKVPAGEFSTVLVEMRVKDTKRYGGEGVIRMYLTDDARRVPLRIESPMPVVGSTVLTLESATLEGGAKLTQR